MEASLRSCRVEGNMYILGESAPVYRVRGYMTEGRIPLLGYLACWLIASAFRVLTCLHFFFTGKNPFAIPGETTILP